MQVGAQKPTDEIHGAWVHIFLARVEGSKDFVSEKPRDGVSKHCPRVIYHSFVSDRMVLPEMILMTAIIPAFITN